MKLAWLSQPSKRHQSGQGIWGTSDLRASVIGFAAGILAAYAGYWESIFGFLFGAFCAREAYLRRKAGNWPKSKLFWFI